VRARWLLLVPFVLVLALMASPLPRLAPPAAAESAGGLSIPYGSSGWRYKVVGHGGEPGFEAPEFADAEWASGTAPFGTAGCAGTAAPVTAWPVNTDLLVRRTLTLNPATLTADPVLKVAIDNDVDVFFNGVLIASNDYEGCGKEKAQFVIPRSLVTAGNNTLAVRAIDRGSISYLDLSLSVAGGADPEAPAPSSEPVADAGPDQSVEEGSVVTLDGSGSRAGNQPMLSPSEKRGSLPGGTSLGVRVEGLDPDLDPAEGLRLTGRVDIGQGPALAKTSVAYVVDISGSANDIVNCGGDANLDRRVGTVLDCEIAAVIALHEKVVASGTVDKVALIPFNSSASARDLDPTSGTATLIAPDADKDGNGVLDLVQAARSLRSGGGTRFAPPTRVACQVLATSGSPNLVTAFMSDGEANDVLPPLPCDPPVTFQTFAVGAGSSCTYGSAGRGLDDIALKTGGTCREVPDVDDLPDILPQVIASKLTKVSYTIDGGEPVDVSAELGLPKDGPIDVDLAVDLPDTLATGTHRICVTAEGTDSGGTGTVTTCSDLVAMTGELSYRWRVVSSEGPRIFLTARTSPTASFVAPDDGRYVLELEVTDELGNVATDRVVVEVGNQVPELRVHPGTAFAGGVTQVNGTFTDLGWMDTHAATVDWGDGVVDEVDVSVQGSGWGSFFGSHVYRDPGTYRVEVTLTDDDGGAATREIAQLEVQTPVAVWANSQDLKESFNWAGGEGSIQGRVHTNGLLRFVGASKAVRGATTYAGAISADTTKNSFAPAPVTAPVQDFPVHYDVADYRPDGTVSREVGSAYHDMSNACAGGTWHEVQSVLASGVYYAPCAIQLNGSDIGGRVTLVSEKSIKIAGSRPTFEPYHDGLLLLAGANTTNAIDVAASSSKFLGVMFAGAGQISVSGSSNRFYCGVLGDRVSITGADTDIRGAACGRPDATVADPIVVPDLRATLAVDREDALPREDLGYDLTVTNAGATLVVPALVGLENVDEVTETVTGYDFGLERLDTATNTWVPLATKGDEGLRIDLRPNPYPDVVYPTDNGVADTVVPAGGWATWGLQAVLAMTPAQTKALLDPEETAGIRTRVDFQLTPSRAQARRLYTHGDDFIAALRDKGADVTAAEATLVLPSGETEAISGDTAGLTTITPGATVGIDRSWSVPAPAPRADTESDHGYLARLRALDGTPLTAASFVLATGGVGRLVAPLSTATTTRELPVVKLATEGPRAVTAGTEADYTLRLANIGSRTAADLDVKATAAGAPLTVADPPTTLDAGELTTATTRYRANATPAGGTVPLRGTATWSDAVGNTYGETGSTLPVTEQAPAKIQATLAEVLVGDPGGDGAASPGDRLRYTLVVRNTGDVPLSGVTATIPLDENTDFVADSAAVPAGGTSSHADSVVTITLPDIPGQGARTATYDVTIRDPFPHGVTNVTVQGTITATGQDPALTDDVTEPGDADPTVTPVIRSFADLAALLTGRLAIDADGSGTVTPGDTLAYRLEVTSLGTQLVTSLRASVPTPVGTSLVAGSVTTSQGTVTPDAVKADLGDLGPFQAADVDFRVRVDQPLAADITAISTQAEVTSDQLAAVLSDDPATAEVGDPTVLPVGQAPGEPDRYGPVIDDLTPADGTIVTEPVHIQTTLTPPDGLTLDSWVVDYRRADDTNATVLATGTGDTVDAVLDPTVLPNGTYVVTVRGTTDVGGLTTREITVVVDGDMKLGRYTTTLTDMTVGVAGLPIQVQRSYDSFDKTQGDFGVGWNLDLADFQISSNGPLGEGGWTMQGCGGGLIFTPLCFTSDRPHFVTVTWPDGRNEMFDLTPAEGSTFFPGLTRAKFTGRPGTTSKLEAVDSDLFWVNGNLNGGAFGGDGIYDPTAFVLTDKYGTKYSLEIAAGLKRIEDMTGNVTTFTKKGISSSRGPSVTFTRDDLDRITKVTGPDGKTVTYGYDVDGNLDAVTNQLGQTTTYDYLPGHYLDKVTGPDAKVMARLEHTDGRLTALIDGAGYRTEISSDPDMRQESVTSPDGRMTTLSSYDDAGNLVREDRVADGETHTTQWTYDDARRVTSETGPDDTSTHLTWNEHGDVTSVSDAFGRVRRFEYDAAHNLVREIGPTGRVDAALDYNGHGQVTLKTRPDGSVYAMEYDARGQLVTLKINGEVVQTFTYSDEGRVTSIKDVGQPLKTYSYDELGRVTTYDDGINPQTSYTYNAVGSLTGVVDASGSSRSWVWDDYGNLVAETDPLGLTTRRTYDAASRLETVTDRNGALTRYAYDDNGRLLQEIRPDNTTQSTYDGFGRLTSLSDDDSRLDFVYNAAGDLVSQRSRGVGVDLPDVTLGYEYDDTGVVTAVTGPDGTRRYSYDGGGRLERLTDNDGGQFALHYDDLDRLTRMERPNGISDVLTWRLDGELASKVALRGVETVSSFSYEYDDAGRRVAATDLDGRHDYTYDPTGRQIGATHPAASGIPAESYTYDTVGNRTSWAGSPASAVVHDEAHRLRSDGRFDYAYDGEGNLIRRVERATGKVREYTWGSGGELLRIDDGATVTRYRYDALGRRTEVVGPQQVRRFVYDGTNVAYVYNADNEIAEAFTTTSVTNMVLARSTDGAKSYPITDALGSVTAYSNADGDLSDRVGYSAFGVPTSRDSTVYGYTGHQYDGDTGLIYARARYYDPELGRFLSEDPVPSINPYPYVGNEPCNAVDPTGAVAAMEYSKLQRMGAMIARSVAEEAGSFACASLMNAVLGFAESSNIKGQKGEDFVSKALGVDKNTDAFPGKSGHNRIPDFIKKDKFYEVKNVRYLRLTKQLEDMIGIAQREGRELVIVTRQSTTLGSPNSRLGRALAAGKLRIVACLPG
jgi:RHS repeat-associated protein/uncharacterized repeat protein (TIGR01451 family)